MLRLFSYTSMFQMLKTACLGLNWVQFIPAIVSAASSIYSASKAGKGGSGDAGGGEGGFYTDPNVQAGIGPRMSMAQDMYSGNMNPYYSELGEIGGPDFDNYMKQIGSDITGQVGESAAIRGVGRGGLASKMTAQALGKVLPGLYMNERNRAYKERGNFLNMGTKMFSDISQQGISNQGQINNYNTNMAKIAAGQDDGDGGFMGNLGKIAGMAGSMFGGEKTSGGAVGSFDSGAYDSAMGSGLDYNAGDYNMDYTNAYSDYPSIGQNFNNSYLS